MCFFWYSFTTSHTDTHTHAPQFNTHNRNFTNNRQSVNQMIESNGSSKHLHATLPRETTTLPASGNLHHPAGPLGKFPVPVPVGPFHPSNDIDKQMFKQNLKIQWIAIIIFSMVTWSVCLWLFYLSDHITSCPNESPNFRPLAPQGTSAFHTNWWPKSVPFGAWQIKTIRSGFIAANLTERRVVCLELDRKHIEQQKWESPKIKNNKKGTKSCRKRRTTTTTS